MSEIQVINGQNIKLHSFGIKESRDNLKPLTDLAKV